MKADEMVVWDERWSSLKQLIDELKRITAERRNAEVDSSERRFVAIKNLEQLLLDLQAFAENQFHYFREKFFNKEPDPKKSTRFPQEHVMMVTLDQVGYDLWVIAHAIDQRFSQLPVINTTLEIADELCRLALLPAAPLGLNDTRVISYLHKSPSIRVIPYGKNALIGIPHTAVDVKRDFLAIPHEVGHFVFWHGLIDGETTIADHFMDNAPRAREWVYRWREELFADIYGCFIAGPILALSFQDLHLQQSQPDFYKDDWDHPSPVLRPNVYTKGVHRAGYSRWAELLNERWNGKDGQNNGKRHERTKRMPKSNNSPDDEDYSYEFRLRPNNPTNVETEAISTAPEDTNPSLPVNRMIRFIFDNVINQLDNLAQNNWWRAIVSDGDENSTVEDLEQLMENFPAKFNDLQLSQIEDPGKVDRPTFTPDHYKELKDRWEDRPKQEKTDPTWYQVFGAGGWTTEGPHSNPPGP